MGNDPTSSITNQNTQIKTLPDTTPLIFQWIPYEFGRSVPNNIQYPYQQRIVNWAIKEPQREIYLVINGAGLKEDEFIQLKKDFDNTATHNIKVENFQDLSRKKGFEDFEISSNRILTNGLEIMYTEGKENSLGLSRADVIDLTRLIILRNVKILTGKEEAIYLDFDILPHPDKKIGEVNINNGILLTKHSSNSGSSQVLDNSIIGINSESQIIIQQMLSHIKSCIMRYGRGPDMVFSNMMEPIKSIFNGLEKSKESLELIKQLWHEGDIPGHEAADLALRAEYEKWITPYLFQENGGNVKITSDSSFKETDALYEGPNLLLNFSSIQETENIDEISNNDSGLFGATGETFLDNCSELS